MLFSVPWGKMTHEKTRSKKFRDTIPLRKEKAKTDFFDLVIILHRNREKTS
jgi:hypothetical protein